jgi:hypothetical protein
MIINNSHHGGCDGGILYQEKSMKRVTEGILGAVPFPPKPPLDLCKERFAPGSIQGLNPGTSE